jgi:hypothetical protein
MLQQLLNNRGVPKRRLNAQAIGHPEQVVEGELRWGLMEATLVA